MKTDYTNNNRKARGFSLVEMLVVIAVIGIVAAIAVPNMGSVTDRADEAAAKRNAQTAAMLYAGAISAGADFVGTDKASILNELIGGKVGADVGGSEFKMSPLAESEKTQALDYLNYDATADLLTYVSDGGQGQGVVAAAAWGDWTPETGQSWWVGSVVDGETGESTDGMAFRSEEEAISTIAQLTEQFGDLGFYTSSYQVEENFHEVYDVFDDYEVGETFYYIQM